MTPDSAPRGPSPDISDAAIDACAREMTAGMPRDDLARRVVASLETGSRGRAWQAPRWRPAFATLVLAVVAAGAWWWIAPGPPPTRLASKETHSGPPAPRPGDEVFTEATAQNERDGAGVRAAAALTTGPRTRTDRQASPDFAGPAGVDAPPPEGAVAGFEAVEIPLLDGPAHVQIDAIAIAPLAVDRLAVDPLAASPLTDEPPLSSDERSEGVR